MGKSRAEYMREYRAKHPEYRARQLEKLDEWREKNPEKVREQWKRQSARRSAKGPRVRETTAPCAKCGGLERYRSGACKACNAEAERRRKAADPDGFRRAAAERVRRSRARMSPDDKKTVNAASNLRAALKRFGMTMGQYVLMRDEQDDRCAVCGKKEDGSWSHRLHIDHCHTTGKVRGLLCSNCNTAIGLFGDDPSIMEAAIAYVRSHAVSP